MALTVTLDITGLDPMIGITDPKLYRKLLSAGMRAAGKGVRIDASREIAARYNIGALRARRDIQPPTIQLGTDPTITMRFSRRAPTVRAYGARERARGSGVSWKVFAGGRTYSNPKAFWIPVRSKDGDEQRIPFIRTAPKGRKNIRSLTGPSIGSVFIRQGKFVPDIQEAGLKGANERFVKELERRLAAAKRGFGR